MAGRRREEWPAERLGKPASGAVAGGVGSASRFSTRNCRGAGPGNWDGRGLSLPISVGGARDPRRGALDREVGGGNFGWCREGGSNPRRGGSKESLLWARAKEGRPEGPCVRRTQRQYRGRATQCARYFSAWQDSGGDDNFMTVQVGRRRNHLPRCFL